MRLLWLNLAVIRTLSRINQNLHRETHRNLTEFSSHNTYYVKKTILLDKPYSLCYTDYVDSHRGFLEMALTEMHREYTEILGEYWEVDWQWLPVYGGVFCSAVVS